jgi:hypothetical protein
MAGITIQFRRGTTANHSAFTGAAGEITVDTTKWTLVLHDNSTVGGFAMSKEGHTHTIANITDIRYQTLRRAGTPFTQRSRINFSSGFALTDDSGNDQTTVDLNDSGVTGATYGSGTTVAQVQVSSKGIITTASSVAIDVTALLPTASGNAGRFLSTDGSTGRSWDHPVSVTAYGSAPSPATGNTGRVVLPGTGFGLRRSTGSAYESFGPLVKFETPNFGSFSWINQGGSAVSSSSLGGVFIDTVAAEASENLRLMQASLSAAPWKITAAFYPYLTGSTPAECGIFLRNSTDSRIVTYGASFGSSTWLRAVGTKWTNETTVDSTYFTTSYGLVAQPIWFQIQDDGADRVFRISMNGVHWHDVNSVVNSDFLSSRSQYGFYVSSRAGTTRAAMSLMSLIVE